ncbi:MAG: BrnA antitoxin family protein [Candidatus Sulfotelmatobacter sp.]
MKGKTTQTNSGARAKGATDFKRLRTMRDADIDFSDIPRLSKSFWKTARLTMPEPKDRLTIRVDRDVVQWLKKNGPGYQTRINAILRSYMEAKANGAR